MTTCDETINVKIFIHLFIYQKEIPESFTIFKIIHLMKV